MEELFINEYCNTVKQRTIVYYGNWFPDSEINLGDYGLMQGNKFIKIGNLKEHGIRFSTRSNNEISSRNIFSEDCVDFYQEDANFNVKNFNRASLNIVMKNKGNFFLTLSDCKLKYILNKQSLKIPIINLIKKKKMSWEYVVITDLVDCKKLFLAISNENDAHIKLLTALPNEKRIKFSDPEQEWMINEKTGIGYLLNIKKNSTPLFGICGFSNKWKINNKEIPIMIKNSKFLTSYLMTMNKLSHISADNTYDLDNIEKMGQKYKRSVVRYTQFDYLRNDLKNGITFRYDYPYDKSNRFEPVIDDKLITYPQLINKHSRSITEKLYEAQDSEKDFISLNLEYSNNSDFVQIF